MSGRPSTFDVPVGSRSTIATIYAPAHPTSAVLVLAPGAGAPQSHPWMVAMARAIAARGPRVLTFDFLYARAGRRAPDRSDVLEATWLAVLSAVRAQSEVPEPRLFIGGKSMGGRIASQVAAKNAAGAISGLVLLGYPLHPPAKPTQLRAAHLQEITAPTLFFQGSRDSFGTPAELGPIVAALPAGGRMIVVEGGDHSLAIRRKGGPSLDDVMATVATEIAAFCDVR